MQATKNKETNQLSFQDEANIIRIYDFIRQNKKPTTLIDLYIELIDLDKTTMRSSLQVLIDNGYIMDQIINGDETYQALDSKKKFNNRDTKSMIRYIHTHIEKKNLSNFMRTIPSVSVINDREFSKYSKLGKFYTLIGYIEKHYHKHLSMDDYKKIFKKHQFLSQKEYKETNLNDLFYENEEGLVYYQKGAPRHFYKPLMVRNNYFEFNKVISRDNKIFYPDEDKPEYVNNEDAIKEFLKPYGRLLK